MNEFAIACGDERTSDLQRDVERSGTIDWSFATNAIFNRLALDEFHCVKIFAVLAAEMKNRGNVAMSQLGGGARFGQKTRATRFIRQEARVNYFECDLTTEICVERFVCHTHGAAAEFDRGPGLISNQFVLVEAMWPASVLDIIAAQRSVQETINAKLFCAFG
jgi:hypothetical protein